MNEIPEEIKDFILDLVNKADVCNEKTKGHSNCSLAVEGLNVPIRVDDPHLLFLGAALLPNILNYLVNILPQFLYPYIVAYLQELKEYREDPFVINELYNLVKDLKDGNILDSSETSREEVEVQ